MQEELETLVLKSQNGDKEAYGKIYNIFLKRIYRFVYYQIQDHETAQDIAQTTFIKIWKAISTFSFDKGSFESFLFKVAKNLTIDQCRKKKNISFEVTGDLASKEDIEENIAKDEEKEIVHLAISKLDKTDKQIVILRYFEELPTADIAEIVGIKDGALRVRIHRILKKLKNYL